MSNSIEDKDADRLPIQPPASEYPVSESVATSITMVFKTSESLDHDTIERRKTARQQRLDAILAEIDRERSVVKDRMSPSCSEESETHDDTFLINNT